MTGDTGHADNVKSKYGTGNDLDIYHDGSHTYIKENGTGQLFIEGTALRLRTSAGVNYFLADENGRTGMFHSGTEKLSTTSTGIDVTGTVTADGLVVGDGTLTVSSSDLIINAADDLFLRSAGTSSVDMYGDGQAT